MKNLSKRIVQIMFVVFVSSALFVIVNGQTVQKWVVPAKFTTLKNPTTNNKENIANGKELYAKHCRSCHGAAGLGDGAKAASLDVPCGDFSAAKFQGQQDGVIFFKITEGLAKMPSFKKNIPDDNDRWMIVHYLRTFKGK